MEDWRMRTPNTLSIDRRWLSFLVSIVTMAACTKTALKSAQPDAGMPDLVGTPDVMTTDAVVEKDLLPDLENPPPDAVGDLQPPGDDVRDTLSVADTSVPVEAHTDVRDALPVADTSVPVEAQTDLRDALPVADTSVPVEARSDIGAPSDVSADASALPADIVVFPNKDLPNADDQCIAATPGWIELVATSLPDAQKCASDADCSQAGFDTKCGQVCLMAINLMMPGSFDSKLQTYANDHCASCPQPTPPGVMNPACRSSGTPYCHAGRCEFR
jgi:hypothetical protein